MSEIVLGVGTSHTPQLSSGTSEVLNWIAVAGVVENARMTVVDYVPGYRSMAGTGMAFAAGEP